MSVQDSFHENIVTAASKDHKVHTSDVFSNLVKLSVQDFFHSQYGQRILHDLKLCQFDSSGKLYYDNFILFGVTETFHARHGRKIDKVVADLLQETETAVTTVKAAQTAVTTVKAAQSAVGGERLSRLVHSENILNTGLESLMIEIKDVSSHLPQSPASFNETKVRKILKRIKTNLLDYWFQFLPNKNISLSFYDARFTLDNLLYWLMTLQNTGIQMLTNSSFLKRYLAFTFEVSSKILQMTHDRIDLTAQTGKIDDQIKLMRRYLAIYITLYLLLLRSVKATLVKSKVRSNVTEPSV